MLTFSKDASRNPPVPEHTGLRQAIQVTMYRYSESGTLLEDTLPIEGTEYVAISHVWGRGLEWRQILGIKGGVYSSKEKAEFLTHRFPSIIGDSWFWMDILCVDQHDDEARVAVTQHIPAIFRGSRRTIVIRGGAGLRTCCADSYDFLPGKEAYNYNTVRDHHITVHGRDIHFEEDVLVRLWPLQEILLSDCLQFVRCDNVEDEKITRAYPSDGPGLTSLSSANILTDLVSLAVAWAFLGNNPTGSNVPIKEFQQAFLNGGAVARDPMNRQRMVPAGAELYMHFDSTRETGKDRDFILAIMPQYKFYIVPKDAKKMSFEQLFVDCCHQLDRAGPSLPPDGRLKPLLVSDSFGNREGFEATDNIPLPTTLGDFIKLLGGSVPIPTEEAAGIALPTENDHDVRYQVQADEVDYNNEFETIRVVKESMNASEEVWQTALSSIYGKILAGSGSDNRNQTRSDDTMPDLRMLRNVFEILMTRESDSSRAAAVLVQNSKFQESFQPTLQAVVRYTALISCGVPVDGTAFEWSKQNIMPLMVTFRGQQLLALAPKIIMEAKKDSEFFLRKGTRGLWVLSPEAEDRWVLVARNKPVTGTRSIETLCLFPARIGSS